MKFVLGVLFLNLLRDLNWVCFGFFFFLFLIWCDRVRLECNLFWVLLLFDFVLGFFSLICCEV